MLPVWVAERLRDLIQRSADSGSVPFAVTAERFEDIPAALAGLVDAVIRVPSLRDRPEDVLPLANHIATRTRGREIGFSATAARALRCHDWPGNVDELARVVSAAAGRADVIDIDLLPQEVLAGNTRHLSRIEAFERGEIVRTLNADGLTMAEVARELGMSRATLYRKITQYNIEVPRESR
jgi:DNA-binding NtrC family response regulator